MKTQIWTSIARRRRRAPFSACRTSSHCRRRPEGSCEERLAANLKAMDPETMLKTWLPATLKGFEQLQETFFSQMGQAGRPKK